MNGYTQDGRPLAIETPLGKDTLLLIGFSGQEAISQLFSFQLETLAKNETAIPFEQLMGQNVTVEWELPTNNKRFCNGIVVRLLEGRRDKIFTEYTLEIVPQLWLLTRKVQSRIFQHLSVPAILKKVLEGVDAGFELQGTFYPRDYCVQYRETDFNFVSRLMEEEGIYYFFKHTSNGHKMVIANTPQSHPDVSEPSTILYEPVFGGLRREDRIYAWNKSQELRSGKYTLWDHCFELPHRHLEGSKRIQDSAQVGEVTHTFKAGYNEKLEIYDFPGEYAQRFDGVSKNGGEQSAEVQKIWEDNERTVGIRMQQEALPSLLIQGGSYCRQFTSGYRFTLERHFNADGPYVFKSVQHASRLDNYRSKGDIFSYSNTFTCIPFTLPYRPPRITSKPFVQGSQTAVVVGPTGQEIFTDKYGRVKVQFHWDRDGRNDPDSSCWIRVAQVCAGRRWGASFWPRIGQEVVVSFLEGDPDQPIIIGSVYNAEQMPPYLGDGLDPKHKRDPNVSGIKSNTTLGGVGFNEIRFDDTKDKEQVFIHAERNFEVTTKNDSLARTYGNRHQIIGQEKDGSKTGDQLETVYHDKQIKVDHDHVEQIGNSMQLYIGGIDGGTGDLDIVVDGEKKESVGKDDHLHVKGNRKEKIDSDQSLTVGGSQQEKVGMKHAVDAGQEIHLKGGMTVVIEAGMQLTLKGAGGFVDIGPTGVTIQGTMVMINSGGAAGSGSGSSPSSPTDPKQASPKDPTVADDSKSGQRSCK
jgi:type VI secretion system secreted protein VgrG